MERVRTTPSSPRVIAELLDVAEDGRVAVLLVGGDRVHVDVLSLPAGAQLGARLVPDGQGGYTYAPALPSSGVAAQIVGAMVRSLCALFHLSDAEARQVAREYLDGES